MLLQLFIIIFRNPSYSSMATPWNIKNWIALSTSSTAVLWTTSLDFLKITAEHDFLTYWNKESAKSIIFERDNKELWSPNGF